MPNLSPQELPQCQTHQEPTMVVSNAWKVLMSGRFCLPEVMVLAPATAVWGVNPFTSDKTGAQSE